MSQEFLIETCTKYKDFTSSLGLEFGFPMPLTLSVSFFPDTMVGGWGRSYLCFSKSILINSHKVPMQYMAIYIVSSFATRLPP